MITKVFAKGFKGLEFETELQKHTLFTGPNGAGKSARSQALVLAMMGYVPGIAKTNSDILDTFGANGNLTAGFYIGDTSFERRFTRSAKGKVSQAYRVNGKKASKESYIAGMAGAERLKVLDLQSFLDLSSQKKIDLLFELFPPEGDISSLQDGIDTTTEKKNELFKKISDLEKTAARLIERRSVMELPAGSLLETQRDIAITASEQETARKNLETEKILIAERAAKKKAEEEAAEKAKKVKEAAEKVMKEATEKKEPVSMITKTPEEFATQLDAADDMAKVPENILNPPSSTANEVESILSIMSAIKSAGCSSCAALLVAKKELRKYQSAERKVA